MILPINKTTFNAAVKRLRDTFTMDKQIDDLAHQLKADKEHALHDAIIQYRDSKKTPAKMDRRRASNMLATSITGDDYNVLSAKLKASETAEKDIQLTEYHANMIRDLVFTNSKQGEKQKRHLIATLTDILCHKDSYPCTDETMQIEFYNVVCNLEAKTKADFHGAMQYLFANHSINKIITSGFDSHQFTRYNEEHHSRTIELFFDNSDVIKFDYSYSCSEYGQDEFSLELTFNDNDIYDIYQECYDDYESMIEDISDHISTTHCGECEPDLVDMDDERNKLIKAFVIPAMKHAFS